MPQHSGKDFEELVANTIKKITETHRHINPGNPFCCLLYTQTPEKFLSADTITPRNSLRDAVVELFRQLDGNHYVFGRITGSHSLEVFRKQK